MFMFDQKSANKAYLSKFVELNNISPKLISESMIKNVDQNKRFHDLSLLLTLLIYLRKHTLRVYINEITNIRKHNI